LSDIFTEMLLLLSSSMRAGGLPMIAILFLLEAVREPADFLK